MKYVALNHFSLIFLWSCFLMIFMKFSQIKLVLRFINILIRNVFLIKIEYIFFLILLNTDILDPQILLPRFCYFLYILDFGFFFNSQKILFFKK